MLPQALAPLAAWPQFVAWRLEWNAERSKWDKIPYSPIHGRKASSTNPADWGTHEQAQAYAAANGMGGIGFVFTERDPFWFVDIDGALQDGRWSLVAQELCTRLAGAAVEVSQSGTGLHIIGSGAIAPGHRNKNIPLHLELYTKERFVALTGTQASGDAGCDLSPALAGVAEQFFKRDPGQTADEWTTEPDPEWRGPEDDAELVARMLRSQSQSASAAFGGSAASVPFEDLFTANADALAARWPAPGGYDASSADQSIANILAFWTGRNCDRIERIMRMSALARPKWEPHVHATYLQNTILKAIGLVRNVYKQREPSTAAPAPPPPEPEQIEDAGFLVREGGGRAMYQHQLDLFKGCVYVRSLNKIMTPRGDLLDQARFNVEYGGKSFVIDLEGKKETNSAWLAFTENQAFQPTMADRMCFRPEHGAGGVVRDSGKVLANGYFPVEPDDIEGDASPFLDHLRKMLPHGDDYNLLISWMAAAIQNPGEKLQWWPVVQGAEGNFKTFLLLIMSHAVGSHYAHMPNMDKMVKGNSNFNGWIDRKLFLGLEEVYAANRREFFDSFKTTVTNLSLPIEGKGLEETTGDNRANGIITTNYQDGVPVIGRSRRFGAFFCAQQTPEDMLRDGMDAAYVLRLKNWLLGRKEYAAHGSNYGIRVMAHHLRHMEILEQFNPLNMSRAPETTSTAAAMLAGRGNVEQLVQEAIDEGRQGFAGGWVSSIFLDRLLEMRKAKIPYNKRRDVLVTLGYDYHPALTDGGRVNNAVAPDGGKPRLYCRIGSIQFNNLISPAEVAKSYSEAQLKAGNDISAAGVAFNNN